MDVQALICGYIPNGLSLLACIALFYSYSSVSNRAVGLKMIFVMGVSDFIYHLLTVGHDIIVEEYAKTDNDSLKKIIYWLQVIIQACLHFSQFWACSIAFFLYQLVSMKESFHHIRYLNRSFMLCLGLILVLKGV